MEIPPNPIMLERAPCKSLPKYSDLWYQFTPDQSQLTTNGQCKNLHLAYLPTTLKPTTNQIVDQPGSKLQNV